MDSLLRDINREREKMNADISNLQRHYEKMESYIAQYMRQHTMEWAKLLVWHPHMTLMIVETTRIVYRDDKYTMGDIEPIRITLLTTEGISDWLMKPTLSKSVSGEEYHGLTDADVAKSPTFAEVWPDIERVLHTRPVVIFGAEWARNAIQSVLNLPNVLPDAFCLHNKCKEYYGEFYDLSLEKVLAYQGIEKKREEMTDSRERLLMVAQVVHNLAAGMPKHEPRPENNGNEDQNTPDELGNLDDHPF